MLDKSVWDQEVPVPLSAISFVDDGILKKLPPGTTITRIFASGASYWARTAKIEAKNSRGEKDSYFLKVHQGASGKTMVSSEFQSMGVLYKVIPEMVARPVGWGSYQSVLDTHFFVCEFRELSEDVPDVADFPALVAEMHKRGVSPDGKFGFSLETFGGNNPQMFPVSDTWEECFSKGMQGIFAAELKTHGPDEEIEMLTKAMVEKVIPRLLRPLETEGGTVVPRLVHGDLWDGNASVDVSTGSPLIFDATPLYAHNEYELGPWRGARHKMTRAYVEEYMKHFQVSEPAVEFNDRGELYCLVKDTMHKLLDKYGEGYEGYAERHGFVAA
ncbi:uncharacterized protein RSE6_12045 [Rhynchosporium secalis]|uniref:protein-ribulosamine 3-kinase n=1 Tax=Rhynchosporium secalis TaxID=38038 RepID=A0A1E1MPF1_RHYSE|nr:uncharacterized protein RSE6_12045 [Rhynchosporium secalis]